MKVVLFCGGPGLRLPERGELVPKPMVPLGYRPVLWHAMRYYAHFGWDDFILCLGERADLIKAYFLDYEEALSNDFVLSGGGRSVELLSSDIASWRITFADTGITTTIGERLLTVRHHLEGEDLFLANYADVVTNAPLDEMVADFRGRTEIAALMAVRPSYSFHVVEDDEHGHVSALRDVESADLWINGGYYMFRPAIFDYLRPGEELVEGTLSRLAQEGGLVAYRYEGFHMSVDTLKDLQELQGLSATGRPPWALWVPGVAKGERRSWVSDAPAES